MAVSNADDNFISVKNRSVFGFSKHDNEIDYKTDLSHPSVDKQIRKRFLLEDVDDDGGASFEVASLLGSTKEK